MTEAIPITSIYTEQLQTAIETQTTVTITTMSGTCVNGLPVSVEHGIVIIQKFGSMDSIRLDRIEILEVFEPGCKLIAGCAR